MTDSNEKAMHFDWSKNFQSIDEDKIIGRNYFLTELRKVKRKKKIKQKPVAQFLTKCIFVNFLQISRRQDDFRKYFNGVLRLHKNLKIKAIVEK